MARRRRFDPWRLQDDDEAAPLTCPLCDGLVCPAEDEEMLAGAGEQDAGRDACYQGPWRQAAGFFVQGAAAWRGDGQLQHFDELTPAAAQVLRLLLPPEQMDDRQNFAPSFGEMLELAERFPGMLFHGYRVLPPREDRRITLEGFYVPAGYAEDVLELLQEMSTLPDEWTCVEIDGQRYFRAWWD